LVVMHAGVADGHACWEGEDVPLTEAMRAEYEKRFSTCEVDPNRKAEVEVVITRMMKARLRYDRVAAATGVPWFVIAAIHNMECSGRFDCHLHNGNPLSARTFDDPGGRPIKPPVSGRLPYSWEESAIDALEFDGFDVWREWSVAGTLFKLEAFNGFGPRNHGVPTPYLWAGSQHDLNHDGRIDADELRYSYHGGKYVKDHVWSEKAMSAQIGAAVLLRRMADQSLIDLPFSLKAIDQKCEGVQ